MRYLPRDRGEHPLSHFRSRRQVNHQSAYPPVQRGSKEERTFGMGRTRSVLSLRSGKKAQSPQKRNWKPRRKMRKHALAKNGKGRSRLEGTQRMYMASMSHGV